MRVLPVLLVAEGPPHRGPSFLCPPVDTYLKSVTCRCQPHFFIVLLMAVFTVSMGD